MNQKKSNNKQKINLKEISKQQRKELLQELLPLGKSFLLWIVLVVIVAWDYTNKQWFSMAFVNYTTYLSYGLAKMMFLQAAILGDGVNTVTTLVVNYKSIMIHNYPMIVELECSAYHAYIAMIALVVFSKWSIRQKLINGAIIFGILSFINSFRIVMLGVIGRSFPQIFNIMHDYIWNILLVIVIWGIWELMNRRMQNVESKKVAI